MYSRADLSLSGAVLAGMTRALGGEGLAATRKDGARLGARRGAWFSLRFHGSKSRLTDHETRRSRWANEEEMQACIANFPASVSLWLLRSPRPSQPPRRAPPRMSAGAIAS